MAAQQREHRRRDRPDLYAQLDEPGRQWRDIPMCRDELVRNGNQQSGDAHGHAEHPARSAHHRSGHQHDVSRRTTDLLRRHGERRGGFQHPGQCVHVARRSASRHTLASVPPAYQRRDQRRVHAAHGWRSQSERLLSHHAHGGRFGWADAKHVARHPAAEGEPHAQDESAGIVGAPGRPAAQRRRRSSAWKA